MNQLLLEMTATAVLMMSKRINKMAAELDRLNAASAGIAAGVAAVAARVDELLDMVRNQPPAGVDPAAVDAAAAALEADMQNLANIAAKPV